MNTVLKGGVCSGEQLDESRMGKYARAPYGGVRHACPVSRWCSVCISEEAQIYSYNTDPKCEL